MKILIVDDSRIIRERLLNILDLIEGVCVIEQAEDAEKAIMIYRKLNPDVLILDIHMNGLNGIELLQQLKSEQCTAYVIMLTNFPYPQYRKKCIEEGADYFLDKSTEFDEINVIIKNMVKDNELAMCSNKE